MSKLKSNLRLLMAEAQIDSLSELSRKTNISRPALMKVRDEKDLENIPLKTLIPICEAFDVTLDELIAIIKEDNEDDK